MTMVFGLGAGATWAFVGGLTVNFLTTDPLGTIPLGLLAVAGSTAVAMRAFGRGPLGLAIVAGAAGSLLLDTASAASLALSDGGASPNLGGVVWAFLPTAVLNGVLASLFFLLARAVGARFGGHEPSLV